jgi:hypothetical protein
MWNRNVISEEQGTTTGKATKASNTNHLQALQHRKDIRYERAAYFQKHVTVLLLTYLISGATVLAKLWPHHIIYVRFHDNEFLQGGVVSPTPNPQPEGPGYLS